MGYGLWAMGYGLWAMGIPHPRLRTAILHESIAISIVTSQISQRDITAVQMAIASQIKITLSVI